MVCHKCNKEVVGDYDQFPLNGGGRFWFFHPDCKKKWDEEQLEQMKRLENVRRLAGYVH